MAFVIEQYELHLGPTTGAVVVYTKKDLRGKELELWINEDVHNRVSAQVVERNGSYAAVFPAVPTGKAKVFRWDHGDIKRSAGLTVFADHVAEVDWR